MSKELKNLWDNISAGNYKQAQVKINKELKKQPNNAYYTAVAAYIHFKMKKPDQALEVGRKVAAAAPANAPILSIICEIYGDLGLYEEMSNMLETAYGKDPGNVQILEVWSTAVFDTCYIKGIQKYTMALQKHSGSRVDQFGAVLSMYLAYKQKDVDATSKQLYPMLAGKFLEKLLPVEGPQEAYVYAKGMEMVSIDKLIDYLKSEECKKFGSLDLEVLLIDSLKQAERWQDLYDECEARVKSNDINYIYWSGLVEAAGRLNKLDVVKNTLTACESSSRSAALALVEVNSYLKNSNSLFESLTGFFNKQGHKRATYNDLIRFVHQLEETDQTKFVQWLDSQREAELEKKTLDSLNRLVNIAKFKHDLGIEDSSNIDTYNKTAHLLKDKDVKDYHSGCDLLLVEASKLAKQGDLYKACLLLEIAVQSDKHNFYVRTMLIQLYNLLGAYDRAKAHFGSLSIRMMQQETLSHMLATRCATVEPVDALSSMTTAFAFYKDKDQICQYTKVAYKQPSFTQVEGFIDLQNQMMHSLNYKLLQIENIKSMRLTKQDPSTESMEPVSFEFADNRDFESMWACPGNGPTPRKEYANIMMAREQVIRRLVQGEGLKDKVEQLRKLQANEQTSEQLTVAEKWSIDVIVALGESALDKNNAKSFDRVLSNVLDLPTDYDKWEFYHSLFTVMETCKIILGYITRLKGARHQVKFNASAVEKLHNTVVEEINQIKGAALAAKNTRVERFNRMTDELLPWIESRIPGFTSLAENIIDGVHSAHDKQLTALRASH